MTDTYRLVFQGEMLDGFEPVDVMARVAHALNTDEQGMAELFSGRPVLLQQGVDGVVAHRYVLRFASLGARLRLEPETAPAAPEPAPGPAPAAGAGHAFGRGRRRRPTADGAPLWGWRFAGRLGRQPYARAGLVAAAAMALAAAFVRQDPVAWRLAVGGLVWLVTTVLALRWTVLRLHDADRDARWAALVAMPGVGVIAGAVIAALRGTRGANRHGPEPRRGHAAVTLVVASVVALAGAAGLWALKTWTVPLHQHLRGRALATFEGEYRQAPTHKAFAISPAGPWGWRSGMPSRSAAVYDAMARCERNRRPGQPVCRVLDIDGAPPRPED